MEAKSLTIVWHDNNEPVYSVHFQPNNSGETSARLATGGGDNNVRIWRLRKSDDGTEVEYLSTLTRHTQAVNAVRFDPKGEILASAGDDGTVLLWTLSDDIVKEFGQDPDDELKESWILRHACRSSTSEIYDIAWSPDSKYIITGSTDNVSRIFDASTGLQVCQIAEHNHYVQGVAWDPQDRFIATQSADRSVHIYQLNRSNDHISISPTVFNKVSRAELPTRLSLGESNDEKKSTQILSPQPHISSSSITSPRSPSPLPAVRAQTSNLLNHSSLKSSMLYHTENVESFFRRLTFSPDGSFLFTPTGIFKHSTVSEDSKEEPTNTVYIYSRNGLNKAPIAHLPGFEKPTLAVSFSSVFYELDNDGTKPILDLPYKMIYAVATQDSVFIFDTQHEEALGSISSIHYRILTDLSWNVDGNSLLVSSADGFCTSITFDKKELGTRLSVDYKSLIPSVIEENNSTTAAATSSTTMESPAQAKKRNQVVGTPESVSKKAKTNSSKIVNVPKVNDILPLLTQKSKVVPKETETIVLVEDEKNEPSQTVSIKQKKRISPFLISTETSNATSK